MNNSRQHLKLLFWYLTIPLACTLLLIVTHLPPYSTSPFAAIPFITAAAATTTTTFTPPSSNTTTTFTPSFNITTTTTFIPPSSTTIITTFSPPPSAAVPPPQDKRCTGRYIYIHNLPPRFNADLLRDCKTLCTWTDMCRSISNAGLGPPLSTGAVWYATDQFALEVIFHNRMKQYDCLTADPSAADAFFIPFYSGLDISRYLWDGSHNNSVRDSLSLDLIRWLQSRPEWAAFGGRDHFVVAGRITWDFRRKHDTDGEWGGKFLILPETQNITVLVLETSPWHANEFAVPYPTYFHPSTSGEVLSWQKRMRIAKRKWLFSFAGAPRPQLTSSIRDHVIKQCRESRKCRLLAGRGLYSPGKVMELFRRSVFCLQPPGDSPTRRSVFDAMMAGCVPVFFHPATAYMQYTWHLPRDYKKYSVFIPEDEVREGKVKIEGVLKKVGKKQVKAMREEVIRMIPRLLYADPLSRLDKVRDAFDITVERVIERTKRARKEGWDGEKNEMLQDAQDQWERFLGKP